MARRDTGRRPGVTTEERQRLKALERENRELGRANEIQCKASVGGVLRTGGARPPTEVLVSVSSMRTAPPGEWRARSRENPIGRIHWYE